MFKWKEVKDTSGEWFSHVNYTAVAAYVGTGLLSLLLLALCLQLYNADLRVPLIYNGDGFQVSIMVKGIIDNGNWFFNYYTGAPGGCEWYDFPIPNLLDFLMFRVISWIFPSYALTLNIYYILTFPLSAIIALFVIRQFKVSYLPAIVASLLFAFIPYHFLRGEAHFFLTTYYSIPLVVLIALWTYKGKELFFKKAPDTGKIKLNPDIPLILLGIAICVIAGSSGIYYAFFSCLFIMVAGTTAFISKREKTTLFSAIVCVLIIGATLVAIMSPNLIYRLENGANTEVAARQPADSEFYGLKIIQLLLPIGGHRIPMLAHITQAYNSSAPLVNENMTASLGLAGSIGFLVMLIYLFYRPVNHNRNTSEADNTMQGLSLLNITAVLWGTIGGFASLFAYAIFPMIRSVNRISVYIAFFSLFMMAVLMETAYLRYLKGRLRKVVLVGALGLILVAGVLDQTSNAYIPDYKTLSAEYYSDDKFVKQIESSVPTGSMIFQLPYVPSPEECQVGHMQLYDQSRAYLHSDKLRWSHGAMKGRSTDLFYRELLASNNMTGIVRTLSLMGFNGIYVDRLGYTDNGQGIMANLSKILETQPIVSDNSRLYFYDMRPYNEELKSGYTPDAYKMSRENALHPLEVSWKGGFSIYEGSVDNSWIWCSNQGELHIANDLNTSRNVTLRMSLSTGYWDSSNMMISGPDFTDKIVVEGEGIGYIKKLTVPPGGNVIRFTSDARKLEVPGDSRTLVFRVNNFNMMEKI